MESEAFQLDTRGRLVTDVTEVGSQAKDETKAGKNPNPYEGLLAADGLAAQETFETDAVQKCIKVYEGATGEKVVAPKDLSAGQEGVGAPKRVENRTSNRPPGTPASPAAAAV